MIHPDHFMLRVIQTDGDARAEHSFDWMMMVDGDLAREDMMRLRFKLPRLNRARFNMIILRMSPLLKMQPRLRGGVRRHDRAARMVYLKDSHCRTVWQILFLAAPQFQVSESKTRTPPRACSLQK
ncbi:hypothetical protein HQ393_13080 [Chitinibacter bivalviorum]|uniref:Uncharacterized protein n=1 Tax=Chitinibacter bivalviorum TaxID=2739434 RepID=A0A7H9BLE6_9NEIS|nr:hypothetical protein [Chitinibacter bivalviorum]QLG89098.1 hypothetical protein HQ393_13080 [Chitinibacter bivalviorum]